VTLPLRMATSTVALVLLGHYVERRREARRPPRRPLPPSSPETIALLQAEAWWAEQEGWG
jgi:hypothetical protein